MISRALFLATAILTLAGCGTVQQATTLAVTKAAEINGSALIDAEFVICRAASKGAVDRRYGQTPRRAAAYDAFCSLADDGSVSPGGAAQ